MCCFSISPPVVIMLIANCCAPNTSPPCRNSDLRSPTMPCIFFASSLALLKAEARSLRAFAADLAISRWRFCSISIPFAASLLASACDDNNLLARVISRPVPIPPSWPIADRSPPFSWFIMLATYWILLSSSCIFASIFVVSTLRVTDFSASALNFTSALSSASYRLSDFFISDWRCFSALAASLAAFSASRLFVLFDCSFALFNSFCDAVASSSARFTFLTSVA